MLERRIGTSDRALAFAVRSKHASVLGLCVLAVLAASAVAASGAWATSGVLAWGDNSFGQLCNGSTKTARLPTTVSGISEVKEVAAGSLFSLILLKNETVKACGAGGSGQLGDGKTTASEVPVSVKGLTEVVAIAAGGSHGLALEKNGTVYTWGANEWGQLGNGNTERKDEPEKVPGLTGVVAIAAGKTFSLALEETGTAKAWGANGFGQLGDGSSTGPEKCSLTEETEEFVEEQPCSKKPVEVSGLTEVKAIAAGSKHALALLENGTVKAWGANGVGQLGDGTKTGPETCVVTIERAKKSENEEGPCSRTPVAVSELKEATAIAAGTLHSLAIVGSGEMRAWGAGESGQLGDGKEEGSDVPVKVSEITNATAIAGGGFFSLALLSSGTVDAWGENSSGQLGNNTIKGDDEPMPVLDLEEATCIAAASSFSLACGPHGPVVSTLAPADGPLTGGTRLHIKGEFLTRVVRVEFGQVGEGTEIEEISPTEIAVTTPAGKKLGSVSVTVATKHGDSPNGTGTPKFTYIASGILLGRCSASGTGKYKDAACTEVSSSGSFEWHPGVGSLPRFSDSGGSVTLENTAGTKMTCTKANESGEYAGTNLEINVTLTFTGCALGASKCTSSSAKEGEVVSAPLEGELGWQEKATNKVALDLAPAVESANLVEATCGTSALKVGGSVIAPITPVNKMETAFKVKYKATKGKQNVEHFEGEGNDVLEMKIGSETAKQAGLTLEFTQSNEESVEINTVV